MIIIPIGVEVNNWMDTYLNAKTKLVLHTSHSQLGKLRFLDWRDKQCIFWKIKIIVAVYWNHLIDHNHLESLRYSSSQLDNPKLNKRDYLPQNVDFKYLRRCPQTLINGTKVNKFTEVPHDNSRVCSCRDFTCGNNCRYLMEICIFKLCVRKTVCHGSSFQLLTFQTVGRDDG